MNSSIRNQKIIMLDYGVGNLFSLRSSFAAIGVNVIIAHSPEELIDADKIILPGVGAFANAAEKLQISGLATTLCDLAKKGTYLLGICLGMQLLFEKSYEYGEHKGLGLLRGTVSPIADNVPRTLKTPHIGWNTLHLTRPSSLLSQVKEGDFVYFVHSYYATGCDDAVIATTDYGIPLTAAVQYENICGCQFHPEKSGNVGLKILKTFVDMK